MYRIRESDHPYKLSGDMLRHLQKSTFEVQKTVPSMCADIVVSGTQAEGLQCTSVTNGTLIRLQSSAAAPFTVIKTESREKIRYQA
ncbi:uncharacterized protein Dmul_30000 [Desulfococcus multivorans]|nr:uncharacterized protein Dmul_30000 [Desulfococcus multivorans]